MRQRAACAEMTRPMTVSSAFHLERPGRTGHNRQPPRVPTAIDEHGSRGRRVEDCRASASATSLRRLPCTLYCRGVLIRRTSSSPAAESRPGRSSGSREKHGHLAPKGRRGRTADASKGLVGMPAVRHRQAGFRPKSPVHPSGTPPGWPDSDQPVDAGHGQAKEVD
jgi:hypothetical protein